jgi:transcriptional regulator with GAF, ATPase, and Fis domain
MAETSMAQRLASLARELQSEHGVSDTAQVVCEAAVAWVGDHVQAAVTLVHRHRRVETAAATSDLVRRGDELQYELREGPCLDAAWEQERIYCPDLRDEKRWPLWAPRVVDELGFRSMFCIRLFTNEDTLGALNLYAREVDSFDQAAQDDSIAIAAHAAVAVASAQEIETLSVAVDRRTTIGKALGIVMERYQVSDDQAFRLLTRLSSQGNRKVYAIAEELVRGGRLPEE